MQMRQQRPRLLLHLLLGRALGTRHDLCAHTAGLCGHIARTRHHLRRQSILVTSVVEITSDAPVDRRQERPAPRFLQIRQADGDDEERFEPLAERDDKGLNHGYENANGRVFEAYRVKSDQSSRI